MDKTLPKIKFIRHNEERPVEKFLKALAIPAVIGIVALNTFLYSAHAAFIYNYTGNNFTDVVSPFTTADFFTGFVEFGSAPTTGGETNKTDVIDFSFTAGPLTLTPTSAPFSNFTFNFDSTGNITAWDVAITPLTIAPRRPRIRTCTNTGNALPVETFVGCTIGVVFDEAVTATFPAFERAANTNNPGSWSSPATIPLPAALPLMAAGIGSLALLARRRK